MDFSLLRRAAAPSTRQVAANRDKQAGADPLDLRHCSPRPTDCAAPGRSDLGITLSNSLFGKTNVPGYGHWHLNVDSTTGPMMGTAMMMGMSGTDTFQAEYKIDPARRP